jgi:hypothetical protein
MPIFAAAPAMFSTTTLVFHSALSRSATMRPITSVAPPAG